MVLCSDKAKKSLEQDCNDFGFENKLSMYEKICEDQKKEKEKKAENKDNKPKLKIGIDIDDVLNNFFEHWCEKWNEQCENEDDKVSYLTLENWDLTGFLPEEKLPEFNKIIERPEFYDDLEPNRLAQIVVKELYDKGIEIYLITGTTPTQAVYKTDWVMKHYPFIPTTNLLFVPIGQKHLINVDVIIEDSPDELDEFKCQVLMPVKSYNLKSPYIQRMNITPVNDWLSIRGIFASNYGVLPIEEPDEIKEYFDSFGKPEICASTEVPETEDKDVDLPDNVQVSDNGDIAIEIGNRPNVDTENESENQEPITPDYAARDMRLSERLLAAKDSKELTEILKPTFDDLYNFGYTEALRVVAELIGELMKKIDIKKPSESIERNTDTKN